MRHHITSLVIACACLSALPAIDVPAPGAMPDAQSFAVLVIPDLRATLTRVEAAAAAFGQPLPPGMLAQGLGGELGDPGLATLGTGPIYAIAAPGVPLPTWAVIIPAVKPETYAAAFTALGLATESLPGSLVVAQSIDGTDLGKRLAPALAALAPKSPTTDVRLLLASDRLAGAYLPFLTQMLGQANRAAKTPDANATQFLAIFTAIAQPLFNESGTLQFDLALSASGLRIETVQAPRPGGVIAKGLIAPRPATAKPFAGRLGAGDGHFTLVGRINPTLITALADFLTPFTTNPKTSNVFTPDLVNLIRESAALCTGEMALRQGVGGSMAAQEGFYGITDATKAAALADRLSAVFTKGPLAGFYRDMGITMALQTKVRAGPAGVRIDRLSFTIDDSLLPPGQGEMLAGMLKPSEFAFATDALVMSADPARLDRLLGAGFGPCVLAAEKTLGPGWDGYVDYDLGVQLRNQGKLMPGGAQGPGAMFARMPVGLPLAFSWAVSDGRVRTATYIPMALATAMKQAFAGGAEAAPPAKPPVF
jgi:hypothetical protein